MHKKQLIRGMKIPLKFQDGGFFSKLFSSSLGKNTSSLLSGFAGGQTPLSNMGKDGKVLTEAQLLNQGIGAGLSGAISGVMGLSNINNSSMNSDQKRMAKGDLAVDTISQIAPAFGPIGSAVGAGLGIINKLGGALIGTPKTLKDFKMSDTLGTSTGFGGVKSGVSQMGDTADSYASSGLAGKLFSGKNKLVGKANLLNKQQSMVGGLLDSNKLIKDAASNSTDMFANNNQMKLYGGNMFNSGSVQYGQEGGTLNTSGSSSTKTNEKYSKFLAAKKSLDLSKIKVKKDSVEPTIKKHAEGGTIQPMNVIVDGKLHAHKHSLKEIEELADAEITLKGIPVVTIDEDGEVTQHAEVEKDEVILHFDLSKKLEDLYEEGDEEAMIQAGRILAKELCNNTIDSSSKILENA